MALSVSELFSGLRDYDLSEREMSGAEFWHLLSTPNPTDLIGLRMGYRVEEMLYPAFSPRPGADRFSWRTGLPPLMQACVPHLTDRPDDLYAAIEAAAPAQPTRLFSAHLRWLFGMLAQDQRPAVMVERSGGSLAYAAELLRLFPGARVVHLYRDGRECAVSMSRHGRYKVAMLRAALTVKYGYDPYAVPGPRAAGSPGQRPAAAEEAGRPADDELAGLTPGRIDRESFDRYEIPLRRYGGMWTKMIASGLPDLPGQSRLLNLDYRDLTERPEENIGRLLDFLGLGRDRLLEKSMAAEVRPARNVREQVGEQQWNELTRACYLGMNRLYGRNGWK